MCLGFQAEDQDNEIESKKVAKRIRKQIRKKKKKLANDKPANPENHVSDPEGMQPDNNDASAMESCEDQYEEVEEEIEEVEEEVKESSYQVPERNEEQLSYGLDGKDDKQVSNIIGLKPPIKKKIFDTTQVDRSNMEGNDNSENKVVRNSAENEENSQLTTARRNEDESKNAQSHPIFEVSNVNHEED